MKKIYLLLKIGLVLYVLLLILFPQNKNNLIIASKSPFVWNQDSLWQGLEYKFTEAKRLSPIKLDSIVNNMSADADLMLTKYENTTYTPDHKIHDSIETIFFRIAPFIAAQEKKIRLVYLIF